MRYPKQIFFMPVMQVVALVLVTTNVEPVYGDQDGFYRLVLRNGIEHGQRRVSQSGHVEYITCAGYHIALAKGENAYPQDGHCVYYDTLMHRIVAFKNEPTDRMRYRLIFVPDGPWPSAIPRAK